MPSDDLVLNVRQIAGYPGVSTAPTTAQILMQTAGLGSAYASISPAALVATALAQGGDLVVGGGLLAQSVQGGRAQFSSGAVNLFSAQKASVVEFDATWGSIAGAAIATQAFVEQLVTNLQNTVVWTFNGRRGAVQLWIQDILAAGGAPQFSPVFGGQPLAPTPDLRSCNSRIATTAFVHRAMIAYVDGFFKDLAYVSTFNGRTGAIVLEAADIVAAAPPYAPIDSANLSGLPTAPTAATGTNTGQIATTAFVMNAVQDSVTGVASFNARTGAVILTSADLAGAGGALLNSPLFVGTPQAPTATAGTSTQQLATCAFVAAAVASAGVTSFNTRTGAITLTSGDITGVGGATTAYVDAAVAASVVSFNGRTGAVTFGANDLSAVGGATLASPAFTGLPTAPTAAPATATTQLATCAFVMAALASITTGVTTFNGRTGAVTLQASDLGASVGGPFLALVGGTLSGTLAINPGNISATGTINGGGLSSSGALTVTSAATIGGLLTANSLSVTPGAIASAGGIVGVVNGSNAAAGAVGEFLSNTGSAAISSAVTTTLVGITLTPGDWDVEGNVQFGAGGLVIEAFTLLVSLTANSGSPAPNSGAVGWSFAGGVSGVSCGSGAARVSVAASTPVFLNGSVTYTAGPVSFSALLTARRRR